MHHVLGSAGGESGKHRSTCTESTNVETSGEDQRHTIREGQCSTSVSGPIPSQLGMEPPLDISRLIASSRGDRRRGRSSNMTFPGMTPTRFHNVANQISCHGTSAKRARGTDRSLPFLSPSFSLPSSPLPIPSPLLFTCASVFLARGASVSRRRCPRALFSLVL